MKASEFRDQIIRPTLRIMGGHFDSPAAVTLLLGTAIHESGLQRVTQFNDGLALGFYQIEPKTFYDMYDRYLLNGLSNVARAAVPEPRRSTRAIYKYTLDKFSSGFPSQLDQLKGNLFFATAAARLIYWMRPDPLPEDDLEALAAYWKAQYNTARGKGTTAEFVLKYREAMR